jgi:hypothetical protein
VTRAWVFVVVLATVAGCSSEDPGTTAASEAGLGPDIVLVSAAGRQVAPPSTSCINEAGEAGQATAVCSDYAYSPPARYSVVRPGEEVEIAVLGAAVTRDALAMVGKVLCGLRAPGDEVAHVPLAEGAASWTADLEPGLYEVRVSIGHFEDGKGLSGSTSGSLGLMVSPTRDRRILDGCR